MNVHIIFEATEHRKAIELSRVHAVFIESSWQQLTDLAEIHLPRNVRYFDKQQVKQLFRRGDPVEIKLGYDGVLETQFLGYVKRVSADIPIRIECEDEMFQVKKIPVNYSHPDVLLNDMLKELVPGYEIEALEGVELGAVRFSQTTVGEVLEKLQQEFKLYTFFKPRTKTLISGKVYSSQEESSISGFDLERSVVSNHLEYLHRDDILVKVNGTAINKGEKLEYEYGDDQADKNINWQFSVKNQSALKEAVKRFYEANKRDGFIGSFVGFGVPSVQQGQKIQLNSSLYEDREGIYYIDGVNKSFSSNGYRQQIIVGNQYEQ